ncbi:NAD-dependent epimerase/dehydratase family protein [Nakamurella flavida]|uniref:NAD-dependent epimerase/dehydratase family protein n=1 Tax=Nakamurella flavida TaxID=363630 RepID=A0A939C6F9_9ACTN|nr:NAD-dependent epimerase/dehydratase family protein [Nakamurella flavida]MBM9478019.1 NAD-dependent epimerase/dehydratase family protein [Nakamurella flavida]MDP9778264.1 2'-hydroxyisoflavone reductase [Nakamurella flavida]
MTPSTALVLGGTQFVGRHLVQSLLDAGWAVTLFSRGRTNPDLFPGVARLVGDRQSDVTALAAGRWDVVFDVSAYHPADVTRVADVIQDGCGHYVLVSSVSAYADVSRPGGTEDASLAVIDGPVPAEYDKQYYGELKALCEQVVADRFPVSTMIRPTVVDGPFDTTERLTSWVDRLAAPGAHLVPPDTTTPFQYIDARDLADFMVRVAAQGITGPFTAAARPTTFQEVLDGIDEVVGGVRTFTLTQAELEEEQVQPWVDLPLWLPAGTPGRAGFFALDPGRALAAGLRTRPLVETIRDTHAWSAARDGSGPRIGISLEREADLAARYGQG